VLQGIVLGLVWTASASLPGQLREREEKPLELPEHMRDEDEDVAREPEYVFNPIQAQQDVKVGDYYAKKGNHKAAAGRYAEATKWNPQFAEAFFKLGRAREKLKQNEDALQAYKRFLKLEPEAKEARQVEKKIAALEKKLEPELLPHDKP
jgi:tetratricopeptide (TPR) repeat protein